MALINKIKTIYSEVISALGFTPENAANKGAANGYAPLDANSKLPITNLANTTVTAGTYGSATQTAQYTVDGQGRLTQSANVTITPAFSNITNTPSTLSGYGITDALPTAGGTMTGAITFAGAQTWPTFNQNTTGNAATATALQTARTINGVAFDGTANITVADSTKLSLTGGALTANLIFTNDGTGVVFNSGSIYKKFGTGLVIQRSEDDQDIQVESNDQSQIWTFLHSGNFDAYALALSGGTVTGQIISTRANNAATGGGQIYLNGAVGNRIDFNTNGANPPSFNTRSTGTKITLYPALGASVVDYAIGVAANTLWFSIPSATSRLSTYAATTPVFNVEGDGSTVQSGIAYFEQLAPASKSAAATLTAAELKGGIVQFTGTVAANLTYPTGTALDTALPSSKITDTSFDFSVINTGTAAATMVTNTGMTLVGSQVIAAGTSGLFRARRTAANTFTIYRMS